MPEAELLQAFRRFGEVVGHRLLRGSHCAFIDFLTHAAAAEARRSMHGVRLGPQAIRVEWKAEHQQGGPHGGRGGGPMPPGPPGGPGMYGGRTSPAMQGPPGHMGPGGHHGPGGPAGLQPAMSLQRLESGPVPALPYGAAAGPGRPGLSQPQQHGGPQGMVMWRGMLAKSGAPMCTLVCSAPEVCAGGGRAAEQLGAGWPPSLDVRMRVDLQYVVGSVYQVRAVGSSGWWRSAIGRGSWGVRAWGWSGRSLWACWGCGARGWRKRLRD